ncbi:MAG: hypothetical protein GC182_08985 [Rhodopseudomonas sp.]|nr:hypothetical protein [Rhodopseudomonas sp.]
MRLIRVHTLEMGQVGHTRWFPPGEELPALDWSKATAIETQEVMTVEQFKAKYPEINIEPKRA